ncbi:uncharacterized protein LACBIDRAFT_314209 [Laccaria bicolor S238N-H82]|uniref:Predicted protein n=1 Tax=Laccaria bicolor (strain S238N-H82 / ATCC MYA-4686) TaxID=486041 RepID=B0D1U1_LACBS|nr:uncharacterized protein LACBIDRAFT_314209 [Laccaria bicolor S238N-H82]EDR11703.1 predicted protein [Laccaria bicolor S238N-H82]|eukprot:XP_001877600.1 predicted protein [Laccaria bicolor S238N-H82]
MANPEGSNAKQPTLQNPINDTTTTPTPNSNPFPLPPWYTKSAHFVRQWWPSLPNIPRIGSTVVLLAEHNQVSHRLHFVLAQHYFRVLVNHVEWDNYNLYRTASGLGVNSVTPPPLRPSSSSSSGSQLQSLTTSTSTSTSTTSLSTPTQIVQDDGPMHLWYISMPFEVIVGTMLVAVDFEHAVWIEYVEGGDVDRADEGEKLLRFVVFPAFRDEWECERDLRAGRASGEGGGGRGEVRTLEVPEELNLSVVETINLDQSQGVVTLSDRDGRIFILCYE